MDEFPPGWYPDPTKTAYTWALRYWDGQRWGHKVIPVHGFYYQQVCERYQRLTAQIQKERHRIYLETRAEEVADLNDELEAKVADLQDILESALRREPFSFDSYRGVPELPKPDFLHLETPEKAPTRVAFLLAADGNRPRPLLAELTRILTNQKQRELAAEAAYQKALTARLRREADRIAELAQRRQRWEVEVGRLQEQARQRNQLVDELQSGYLHGDSDAVEAFCELVLRSSRYPSRFPHEFRLAYNPRSRQVIVEYELPRLDQAVPQVKSHKYVKQNDTVTEIPRPEAQRRTLYQSTVAQIALRTLHELFAADTAERIDTIVFNGIVDTIDKGTGRHIRPCVVSVRATRHTFSQIDLTQVDPQACLKHLSAAVSKSAAELLPVRPIVEFDMVDPRFVTESDALRALDIRPNLMELSPREFESLVQNLFTEMGLEARQTRASRDGGVDCVAWDPRPIFGGKVVIQAKRYKNTVGVSAVRDLFGTLQNEGASKGILVTTSGFGAASFEFAKNKPIELLDGSNLLYLLAEHAGIDARIEVPDDWQDPISDSTTYNTEES